METTTTKLNRLNDVFVKYIFFDEDRKPLTLSLINSFFEAEGTPTIVDFTFKDREPDPDSPEAKRPHLDILSVCSDGTVVEIEFQNDQYEGMAERVLLYWSRLAQKLRQGMAYVRIPRIVCINILGYEMFPELPSYHNCYMASNTRHPGVRLSDKLELHFAELPKWEKAHPPAKEMDQLSCWLAYFSPKTTPEELKEIAMQNAMINQAIQAEAPFLANAELMSDYEWSEKQRLDAQAREAFVKNEGIREGKIEGIKEGKIEGANNERYRIASELLSLNMPVEQIAKTTKLTIAEVETIAENN